MKRFGHISIVLLFMGFIYLPFVLSLIQEDKEISSAEKRKLASMPSVELNLDSLTGFPKKFENYYEDHFGLRDKFVILYNYFYFKVLGKSPLASVTVGQDEWLFYNSEGVLVDFLGLVKHQPEKYATWKYVLEDREEWLADQGVRYLFVVAPYKMMIYPEKLPKRVQKKQGTPFLEDFSNYLDAHSDVDGFVDLRNALFTAKEKQQAYFRTDTHWNSDGAYQAYLSIMDRIQQWFPQVRILPEDHLHKEMIDHLGDICITLNLFTIMSESAVEMEISPSCSSETYKKVTSFKHPNKALRGKPLYLPLQNGCPGHPVNALVIHDSFGMFLRPYFNETFGKVIYSNYADLKDLKQLIIDEEIDVVIDVRVARNIYSMLEDDPEIDAYILNKHFPRSDDVRLLVDGAVKQGMLEATHDAEVQEGRNELVVRATGSDPYLEFSFDPETGGDPLLLKLVMTSPAETVMQLFYTTPDQEGYSPDRQVARELKKGKNNLLIRLPHPETQGRIRLDPGVVPGDYLIHSLVIKREERR